MTEAPRSGHPAVDAYLDAGFESVRGMSSRFAAAICAWCLTHQEKLGIAGDVVEIGAFEGRFLIALALALPEGGQAFGMDVFEWPDEGVFGRFVAHGARFGLNAPRYQPWKANSSQMEVAEFVGHVGRPARFIHIDGDHSCEALAHDLELAEAALHPDGLICLDDMLHPGYPFLVTAVNDWLAAHPDWVLMAVLDREDIVAAPKFLLCRRQAVPLYEQPLMEAFPQYHWVLGGDARGHFCLVLTLKPRLAEVD